MACTASRSAAVAAVAIWGMSSMMAHDRLGSAIALTLPASTLCGTARRRLWRRQRQVLANMGFSADHKALGRAPVRRRYPRTRSAPIAASGAHSRCMCRTSRLSVSPHPSIMRSGTDICILKGGLTGSLSTTVQTARSPCKPSCSYLPGEALRGGVALLSQTRRPQ
jgi:hypothetical protein